MNKPEAVGRVEVLSPWSDIDPIKLDSPAPRLATLEHKKIGLFSNFKRSSRPMLEVARDWLQDRYPGMETSLYVPHSPNVPEMEGPDREKFAAWVDAQDGVVLAVGD